MNGVPRAALYCRLSEEDRNKGENDDSASIQNQKAMLLQYAAEQGWTVYDIYSDDDYAGADRSRPAFQRLIADARDGRFDIVLCKTQSRFTRELELVEKYLHNLFPRWGIRFVGLVDNADTANKGNKKARQINGLVNEWYLEDLSENIRSVLDNKRKNGLHIGSFALYGYRKDPEHKGRLLIDEEAAQVVREVFSLYAQGWGKTAIARILNDRGVPNPTAYKQAKGLRDTPPGGKTGTLWKYPAISHMLTNELYIGNMVQGKYGSISYKTKENRPRPPEQWFRVEHTHPPIIPPDLWERVQARIAQRTRPFSSGELGIFAGKCRCASCGYTLRSSKSRGKRYLQCPSRYISHTACPGVFLSQDRLEEQVLEELRQLTETCLDLPTLEQMLDPPLRRDARKQKLTNALLSCQREQERCRQAGLSLYLDRAKGILSSGDYEELCAALRSQTDALHDQMQELSETLKRLEEEANRPVADVLSSLTRPERLTRDMVDTFVDFISIGRDGPSLSVSIHWRF